MTAIQRNRLRAIVDELTDLNGELMALERTERERTHERQAELGAATRCISAGIIELEKLTENANADADTNENG